MFFYKKKTAIVFLLIFILIGSAIIFFSLQSGDASASISSGLSTMLKELFIGKEDLQGGSDVNIESLQISIVGDSFIVDKTYLIKVDINPTNATESYQLKCDNSDSITVSNNIVTFLTEGNIDIYAESESGVKSNTLSIQVLPKQSEIEGLDKNLFNITCSSDIIKANNMYSLSFTYDNKPLALDSYYYYIDNQNIAKMSGRYLGVFLEGEFNVSLYYGKKLQDGTNDENNLLSTKHFVVSSTCDEPELDKVYLNGQEIDDNITLCMNETYTITYGFLSDDCCKAVSWKEQQDNAQIIGGVLQQDGTILVITPTKIGSSVYDIYSPLKSSNVFRSITINVIAKKLPILDISFSYGAFLNVPTTIKLNVADEYAKEGYYAVEDDSVYTYNSKTKQYTFKNVGKYYLTFKSIYYDDEEYTFEVVVTHENFKSVFRKSIGHFTMFLLFGIFGLLSLGYFIKHKGWKYVGVIGVGLIFATISEVLQLPIFTVGRTARVLDSVIDFSGYVLGVLLIVGILLLLKLFRSHKAKDKVE